MLLNIPDTAKEMRGYRGVEWGGQGDEGRSPEVPIMLLKFHYKGSLYLPLLCSLPLWLTLTPSASSVGHIYLHVSPPPLHPLSVRLLEFRPWKRVKGDGGFRGDAVRWKCDVEPRRGQFCTLEKSLKYGEIWEEAGCTALPPFVGFRL